MAHLVICSVCKNKFDRDKEPFALDNRVKSKRYMHADCAKRYYLQHPDSLEPQIIDPNVLVECALCHTKFDKSKEAFIEMANKKVCHKRCYDNAQNAEPVEEDKLNRYIMELYDMDYVYPRIQKQIQKYKKDYGYSYSGIRKALTYYYDIKKNNLDKEKFGDSIGIVPYIYDQAFRYYYSIWEAQQKNQDIFDSPDEIKKYIPRIFEVHIPIPQRMEKKRKLFTFLDLEGDDN